MLKRHTDALWTEMGSQLAVLSMASGRYFEIQGAGPDLWRWLEHPCDLESLTAQLIGKYEVDADQARGDVSRFLAQLREAGLLDDISAPAA